MRAVLRACEPIDVVKPARDRAGEVDSAMDAAACERARQARDARFDGRFYIGVLTTGVYCRPICPVRQPRRENVRFFRSAAAAAEAGFRPCLRCRPESSPGTPLALGTGATLRRALRLIDEGALDRGSVEGLAARLGIGARHLVRLFDRHLGTSPNRVAQTRRLHLAVKLLHETDLPMTQIAHAAGFGSLRRFNEAIRGAYRRPPRSLRHRRTPGTDRSLRLQLAYRPPLDWRRLHAFLALRAVPGIEEVDQDGYRRTIALGGRHGVIEVRPLANTHKLELTVDVPDLGALATLVARARSAFDLDADPLAIERDLGTDPLLGRLVVASPGLRVPGVWDGFELAVRAVLGQLVSVLAARTLAARLVARFGAPLGKRSRGGLTHAFPSPQVLACARLTGLGIPAARAAAIRAIARGVADGQLELASASDLGSLVRALQTLPGIGPWTAQYIAMRAGGQPDAFPGGDLGLRRGAAACLGRSDGALTAAELEHHAERWRPWRAYAAMHLWAVYAELPRRRLRADRFRLHTAPDDRSQR